MKIKILVLLSAAVCLTSCGHTEQTTSKADSSSSEPEDDYSVTYVVPDHLAGLSVSNKTREIIPAAVTDSDGKLAKKGLVFEDEYCRIYYDCTTFFYGYDDENVEYDINFRVESKCDYELDFEGICCVNQVCRDDLYLWGSAEPNDSEGYLSLHTDDEEISAVSDGLHSVSIMADIYKEDSWDNENYLDTTGVITVNFDGKSGEVLAVPDHTVYEDDNVKVDFVNGEFDEDGDYIMNALVENKCDEVLYLTTVDSETDNGWVWCSLSADVLPHKKAFTSGHFYMHDEFKAEDLKTIKLKFKYQIGVDPKTAEYTATEFTELFQ